jgi:transcriptional antiterminator NusG
MEYGDPELQQIHEILHDQAKVTYPWFAVRVRSNYEQVTALHLSNRGYEQFAPSYEVERKWSDRKKRVNQFLFPGYVFSRFDVEHRLPVLTAPGVVGLVGCGKVPSSIPDHEIENIRSMVQSGLLVTPWPFIQVGQQVLIEYGPLAGVEGILQQVKGKFRLVVSICLLQRSVSTEVDRNWVRPIRKLPSNEILSQPAPHGQATSRR